MFVLSDMVLVMSWRKHGGSDATKRERSEQE